MTRRARLTFLLSLLIGALLWVAAGFVVWAVARSA